MLPPARTILSDKDDTSDSTTPQVAEQSHRSDSSQSIVEPAVSPSMVPKANIPLIDLAGGDQLEVARQLVDAAAEQGFIYIKNRGQDISVEDIDSIFDLVIPVRCLLAQFLTD